MTTRAHRAATGIPLHQHVEGAVGRELGFETGTFAQIDLPESGWAHRHGYYTMGLVLSGDGMQAIDGITFDLSQPTLYFIRPGQVHRWDYDRLPDGFVLSFTEAFVRRHASPEMAAQMLHLVHELTDVTKLQLDIDETRALTSLFGELLREYKCRSRGCLSVLYSYLHILVARAGRIAPEPAVHADSPRARQLAREFTELLTARTVPEQTVKAYSDVLCVSRGHLAETIRAVLDRAPGEMIRDAQLTEAKRMLEHTESTVSQIAYSLGFKDAAYFGRFFKREAGVTPGDFRRGRNNAVGI